MHGQGPISIKQKLNHQFSGAEIATSPAIPALLNPSLKLHQDMLQRNEEWADTQDPPEVIKAILPGSCFQPR